MVTPFTQAERKLKREQVIEAGRKTRCALVAEHPTGRQLGQLSEPRVNGLALNLALAATP